MACIAAYYRKQAAKTCAPVESAKDPTTRQQLLDLAAEYDRLADHGLNIYGPRPELVG